MATTYKVGKDGRVTAGGTIYVTKWSGSLKKNTADTTDTSCFDVSTGKTWRKQLPVDYGFEGEIEGYYDFGGGGAIITANLYSDTPLATTLSFDRSTNFGSGNFDFTNVQISSPRDDKISFTASIMSNGPFTLG